MFQLDFSLTEPFIFYFQSGGRECELLLSAVHPQTWQVCYLPSVQVTDSDQEKLRRMMGFATGATLQVVVSQLMYTLDRHS